METAYFDVQDFHKPRAGDEKLAIRFFVKAKQDGEKSQEMGRPIFKEHDYIQIMIPGDRHNIIVRPVTDQDKGRFKKQYDHWKETRQNSLAEGTPLESWGLMGLAEIEEYKYFGIRTVEHLAGMRDDLTQKIMGAGALKMKAIQALEILKGEAPMKKMQAELQQRDAEIESLKKAIEDQGKMLAELQNERKGRKG